jgi:hypothetical protein
VSSAGLGLTLEPRPSSKFGEPLEPIALEKARALDASKLRIREDEFWANGF